MNAPARVFTTDRGWGRPIIERVPLVLPALVLGTIVLVALFAPTLARFSPYEGLLGDALLPPAWFGGSSSHFLGTDQFGRDILTRMMFGARISAVVALLAVVLGGSIGTVLGVLAGYAGGWIDALVMRCVDLALALPLILVGLVVGLAVGPSLGAVVSVLALLIWPRYARQARAEVLAMKDRDFVLLARLAGCSPLSIVVRHILPNITNTLIVLSTLQLAQAILIEASLSFLGAGIPPPEPTWGQMIADGRSLIASSWWLSTLPGIAIMGSVLAINVLGDQLRDRLDPKLRTL